MFLPLCHAAFLETTSQAYLHGKLHRPIVSWIQNLPITDTGFEGWFCCATLFITGNSVAPGKYKSVHVDLIKAAWFHGALCWNCIFCNGILLAINKVAKDSTERHNALFMAHFQGTPFHGSQSFIKHMDDIQMLSLWSRWELRPGQQTETQIPATIWQGWQSDNLTNPLSEGGTWAKKGNVLG